MKTTKILKVLAALVVLSVTLAACGGKHEHGHDHDHGAHDTTSDAGDWKEMDSFHLIMAETFHPYKDSANLEPARVHAEHLAMEADKWASSKLPQKVDNDAVKTSLEKLKTDTRVLADKVKSGASNEDIGIQLTAIHDRFHEIQEAWYGGHH